MLFFLGLIGFFLILCLIFSEFKRRIQLILRRLQNLPEKLKNSRNQKFIKNLEKIISIYIEVIRTSKNGTDFYQHLLKKLYILIGFVDLANFFADSSQSYFGSAITTKWIPYCIQKTKNEPYGFLNLLNTGLFKKPYFRNLSIFDEDKLSNPEYIKKNIDRILEAIANDKIIPSYEIFFWTLFLADIRHFGNDYGFLNKLNNICIQYNFSLSQNMLQLTKHNQDCQNIIQFERDRSFNCFLKDGEYIIKKNNSVKNSRISSFPALYCHLGDELGRIIKDIFENKINSPQIIKMGE